MHGLLVLKLSRASSLLTSAASVSHLASAASARRLASSAAALDCALAPSDFSLTAASLGEGAIQ